MQKTETKLNLITAVKELIQSGESFTVKDITQKAYTNVAAINYYFGDKNTLVNIALGEMIDEFRLIIVNELRRERTSNSEYIENFLTLVAQLYGENRGFIKYIVSNDTGDKSNFINRFLFDEELTGLVYEKMELMTGETRPEVKLCNYMIALSSFVMPLLFECQNDEGSSGMGLSMLQSEEMREVFVAQLMKLFA